VKEFLNAIEQLSKEKGIDIEILYEAIEASLKTACKKNFGTSDNIVVEMNRETGKVKVFAQKEVVEEVEDELIEISLENAKKIRKRLDYGDIANVEITPKNFGRIAAQTAKQVVVQRIREAERDLIYNEFIEKKDEIVTGIVQRVEKGNAFINIGRVEAMLPANEQMTGEEYFLNDRVKVYITDVSLNNKGAQVLISRNHTGLVKRLFEMEVPEIFDGIVEIKSISREGGSRTKIAVFSNDENVDPVGACVGNNGNRVNIVVDELKGEKIDIIVWDEDPAKYIAASLSPAKVISVEVNEAERAATVIVPNDQLSLAIGKAGQNVRLAARLTGWKIDIKSNI